MLDTVLHAILDFVGAHSALLTVLILIALGVGMVLCLTVQKRRFTVREIAVMGMLAALNIVLAEVCKITIIPNALVLSFGFLPIAVCGMLFGVAPTVTVAVVADILGALLFSSGSFYFGYTLTAFLVGLFYALFLHKGFVPRPLRPVPAAGVHRLLRAAQLHLGAQLGHQDRRGGIHRHAADHAAHSVSRIPAFPVAAA